LKKFISTKDSSVKQELSKEPQPNSEEINSSEEADKQNKLENVTFTFYEGKIYTGQWLDD
jgi:hypothetical protein